MTLPDVNADACGAFATRPILATREQAQAVAVGLVGLDAELLDLDAPESVAALIRRAASFAAPCAPRTLRENTLRALRGLTIPAVRKAVEQRDSWSELRDRLDETVESLVSYGDLLELPSQEDEVGRLLYLAPPAFVRVATRAFFLIGGRPDAVDILPSELRSRVEHVSHTRRLVENVDEGLGDRLMGYGLIEIPSQLWLSPPRLESPAMALQRAASLLASRPTRGEVAGLEILDPATAPTFYRGRWRLARRDSGRFIARREQAYGADLWAYVELRDGAVTHLIDLPVDAKVPAARGCDEAWQLQSAIDATNGRPQRFRIRAAAPKGTIIVDFFSPIPRWARRKFDALGERVAPVKCLLSYKCDHAIIDAVRECLTAQLWLSEIDGH